MTPPPASWRGAARALRGCARRTRSRLRRSSVILLYHRVTSGVADPWSLCVSPENFRAHMAVLAERGVATLAELADDLAAGRRGRSVVVTFDDGYADFHETALPILRAAGVAATLFVTTGVLGGDREFWWDALERIVLAAPALPASLAIAIGSEAFTWNAADGARRRLYYALHQRLGRLDGAARAEALAALARWADVEERPRASHRPLGVAAVAAIAREPGVRLGAHTVSHSALSALPVAVQGAEIAESKRTLEAIAEAPVDAFAYPHGDHGPETIALVRDGGFALACGTEAEPVLPDADRFDLPRVEVPNFPGAAFARWLAERVG